MARRPDTTLRNFSVAPKLAVRPPNLTRYGITGRPWMEGGALTVRGFGERVSRPTAAALVVAALKRRGMASRAELSRATGLAESTVSVVVGDLVESGFAEERNGSVDAGVARTGRPPVFVSLGRRAGLVLGVDIGKRHVRIAVSDFAHRLLAEREVDTGEDVPAAEQVRVLAALTEQVLGEVDADRLEVAAVGLGLPGPVAADGRLGSSTILPGWVGVDAAALVGSVLDLPVLVENDGNLGALAEWTWGQGRGVDDLVYLKLSTGIGAGLILGGRLFHGARGAAGEFGHNVIALRGPACRCGNRGCLEAIAGTEAVIRGLTPHLGTNADLDAVLRAAEHGDVACRDALSRSGRAIGAAAATLCNAIDPALVIIGGRLSGAGELVLEPLRAALREGAVGGASDVPIVSSQFGDRAEVLGAVALALLESEGSIV